MLMLHVICCRIQILMLVACARVQERCCRRGVLMALRRPAIHFNQTPAENGKNHSLACATIRLTRLLLIRPPVLAVSRAQSPSDLDAPAMGRKWRSIVSRDSAMPSQRFGALVVVAISLT